MLFNSLDFAVFLPIVFIIYWFVLNKNVKTQNLWLLFASYFFYGWWDPRFLVLIFMSTLIDYVVGKELGKTSNISYRKQLVRTSIIANIGLLAFFKYFNFFVENFQTAFTFFGGEISSSYSLNIILPIGISFYTFQSLSYTIDIYRKKITPTNDFVAFATFVSFFPQLIIGPIERAANMLPQFHKKRNFDANEGILGLKQIVWGLFKKIVIADGCAQYVNAIFIDYETVSSLTLLLGAIYFTIQVYADFSGYSDIAIGTARLFNFKLMTNFNYPLFAKNIAEFWRNWHISLMMWFRDYIYFPLGGSRVNYMKSIRNILIVFIISGLWHGANWTFVFMGVYYGFLYSIHYLFRILYPQKRTAKTHPLIDILKITFTFSLVTLGMILFRAPSMEVALTYASRMILLDFSLELLNIGRYVIEMLPFVIGLLIVEWFSRKKSFPLESHRFSLLQMAIVIALIIFFGSFSDMQEFIYFKF
jgi:alginate O-acetyltransferase complex protein AlgI